MASTEVGHHAGWVYMSQDGQLVVPSSAKLKIEAGGNILEKNIVRTTSTAPISIEPRGMTILAHPKSVMTYGIKQPRTGNELTILIDTTSVKNMKLRASTGVASYAVKFQSSGCVLTFTSEAGKIFKAKPVGAQTMAITMRARSTARWDITHISPSSAGLSQIFSVSTTT